MNYNEPSDDTAQAIVVFNDFYFMIVMHQPFRKWREIWGGL